MKTTIFTLLPSLLAFALIISCESDTNDPPPYSDLSINLSNGTTITKNDIDFYDASTGTYFLKSEISTDAPYTHFNICVDKDTILKGSVHLCTISSFPSTTHYITDCFFAGRKILKIGYHGTGEDLRNAPQIIASLKESNQFRNGLSLKIDSLEILLPASNSNEVLCTITITNNDDIAYYIPDPGKMGDCNYTVYTGGLSFIAQESGINSFIKDLNCYTNEFNLNMNHLSLLPANSEVTFTYASQKYHPITKGNYKVIARFTGVYYTAEFELNQEDGRVWVGEIHAYKEGFIVE
ncbi:MAG: hypothetical protein MI922_18385 [Bacteroidales bacterium]|nr:hypothetical protein [Bacteroidales bacterium]